ncbi:MAG TPA: glutamate--cysteine ligase [Gammaproteobacteria bacterium]|nr:glutamate--cysteine ligase [Gammaproteobacteria bacterium]
MDHNILERRLRWLADAGAPALTPGLEGIEKESLRVTADGRIAKTPHPRALGSALTHPAITTDYSEALLEFITPPQPGTAATLAALCDIHTAVYRELGAEMLWATSMPCAVEGDSGIPIAEYGTSNVGMMKHVYRRGLGYRYGRVMQTISGVHFNYSLPVDFWPAFQEHEQRKDVPQAFMADAYFGLIRNFQRYGWLVPYLFGASPAICKSFLTGGRHDFEEFDDYTWYAPYATSLRMSDIGYKNKNQAHLNISYNSLHDYVAGLTEAISTPEPEYELIGLTGSDGYRQLNTNVLQIENEYYSFIRPKNIAESGEKPTLALKRRGVRYIEVRALDVNAFEPLGVSTAQLDFLETFLIYCLLADSPFTVQNEREAINRNQARVTRRGRDPKLQLESDGSFRPLRDWAHELLAQMAPIAALLDAQSGSDNYTRILAEQRAAVDDPDRTPSARILAEMRAHEEPFFAFALRMSKQHRQFFLDREVPPELLAHFRQAAEQSLAEQAKIEASDTLPFDEFLRQYFAQS